MRRGRSGLWLLLPVALAGFGASDVLAPPGCSATAPALETAPPRVPVADDGQGRLNVHLQSIETHAADVTVTIDGRTAFDASIPGVEADCSIEPVYRYSYDPPGRRLTIEVTAGAEARTRTVPARAGQRWVVVQL